MKRPNQQPKLTSQKFGKETTNKPKSSRRREILKARAEINNIETKKTIQRIMKTGADSSKK